MKNFQNIEYLKKEEYEPLLSYILFSSNKKWVQIINVVLFMIRNAFISWELCLFLNDFSTRKLFQYGPFLCSSLYVTISSFTYLKLYYVYIPHIPKWKLFFWHLNMCSPKMKRYLTKLCYIFQAIYVIQFVITAITTAGNMYVWANRGEDLILMLAWTKKQFPDYYLYLELVILINVPMVLSHVVTPLWYAHYTLFALGLQIHMLRDTLRYIKRGMEKRDKIDMILYDKDYQAYVTKFLNFFISRHQSIVKYANFLIEISENMNSVTISNTILIWLYIVLIIFSDNYSLWVIILGNVSFWPIMVLTLYSCEMLEDASKLLANELYTEVPWYLWNLENLKIFIILHQYTSCRIIRTPMVSFINCNLEFAKQLTKGVYTAFNFYRSMNNR